MMLQADEEDIKKNDTKDFPRIFRENHTALYGFSIVSHSGSHGARK